MRARILLACLLAGVCPAAHAQVSIGIGFPGVSIGINLPAYPTLMPVPGYPVYYDPNAGANYFFYDGVYWVYANDGWYASSWYNGPWNAVQPELVPYFVLRIPILYYAQPPAYFGGWDRRQPPRWGERWGPEWEQRHRGWDRWDRSHAPAPAPLPLYQRRYGADRYPSADAQRQLHGQNYSYQPREPVDRRLYRRLDRGSTPGPGAHPPDHTPPPGSRGQPAPQQQQHPQQQQQQRQPPMRSAPQPQRQQQQQRQQQPQPAPEQQQQRPSDPARQQQRQQSPQQNQQQQQQRQPQREQQPQRPSPPQQPMDRQGDRPPRGPDHP